MKASTKVRLKLLAFSCFTIAVLAPVAIVGLPFRGLQRALKAATPASIRFVRWFEHRISRLELELDIAREIERQEGRRDV